MRTMRIKQISLAATVYNERQLPLYDLPEVALVGRSNVGKSSLINRLANRKNLAKTSATPGKTRSINFYLAAQLVSGGPSRLRLRAGLTASPEGLEQAY